jgi:HSP20 family protein
MNTVAQQNEKEVQTATTASHGYVTPGVNILELPEAYVLEAEMPGVTKEGLSVDVENGVLTLTGRRQPGPDVNWLYRESGDADYRRVFELDPSIDAAKISARLEQGVLTVTLPKAEKAKPRRIEVN